MQNFMKTIISAVKTWTDGRIQESVADWNENDSGKDSYIKNRTHYDARKMETISYTFDGNLEGREIVPVSDAEIFVEIAEDVPVVENLIGGEVKVHTPDSAESMTLSKNEIINVSDDLINVADIILIALNNTELDGLQIKKGIWSLCYLDNGVPIVYAEELSYQTTTGELKKLDSKYLPDNIATTDDVNAKMDMNNPVGTGSFSMNRQANTVIGANSHAEGEYTTASGNNSHAEGEYTTASGNNSHAEGNRVIASSIGSHAEGYNTIASGDYSHAEGYITKATSSSADTVLATSSTNAGYCTHAEGHGTIAYGAVSHAEGNGTKASGINSHAEGYCTQATGECTHAEGRFSRATGKNAHAEGCTIDIHGVAGYYPVVASGESSHAEGSRTTASGDFSHAEGGITIASGHGSHAEGFQTTASGKSSHAEGEYTTASGNNSHAEGGTTTASGDYSHAEGDHITASGACSHAEGSNTTASGHSSHVNGEYNKANRRNQFVYGQYNVAEESSSKYVIGDASTYLTSINSGNYVWVFDESAYTFDTETGLFKVSSYQKITLDALQVGQYFSLSEDITTNGLPYINYLTKKELSNSRYSLTYDGIKSCSVENTRGKYAHIVGNGTSDTARSNAHTLDWNGVGWFQGGLQVGGTAQDNGAKSVLLEGDAVPVPTTATVGQLLSVKAIDESGKPTEWEAVNMAGIDMSALGLRHIRTVTIPTDITTDTSGVNFAEMSSGGALFGFDTDENGEPFELYSDLIIVSNAGYAGTLSNTISVSVNTAIPGYQSGSGIGISTHDGIGISNALKYSISVSHILGGSLESISYGTSFGGGANNQVYSSAKAAGALSSAHYPIQKITVQIPNQGDYGLTAGSWFKFYGR